MARETMLARALVELADTLVSDFDVAELLTVLTDRCVDVLDVAAAGIMLASPAGDLRVMASSSEEMRLLELFELQSQEGPCLDCYNTGEPVVNVDLGGDDHRWPHFAQRATAAGFRSVHALPLRLRGSVLGALNMFHVDTGQMRPADVAAAQALADVATIAILQHRAAAEAKLLNEQLSEALNTRIVIEQAKGMIAQQRGVEMDAAVAALRDHARTHNLRLADLARDVTDGRQDLATLGQPADMSAPGGFSVVVCGVDGEVVVQVVGDVDLLVKDRLGEVLSRLAADGRRLVIDLSQTTFIDSTGLRALLQVWRSRLDAGLVTVLREPAPVVLYTLEIAGLRDDMPIEGITDP